MNWQPYITADPSILAGKPILRDTRLSVEFLLGLIADGWEEKDILTNYLITREQLRACAAYARERVNEESAWAVPV